MLLRAAWDNGLLDALPRSQKAVRRTIRGTVRALGLR